MILALDIVIIMSYYLSMNLKECSCKKMMTTKNVVNVIRYPLGIDFTCSSCGSTKMIRDKKVSLNNIPDWFTRKIK